MKHLRKSILTLLALTLFGGAGAWAQGPTNVTQITTDMLPASWANNYDDGITLEDLQAWGFVAVDASVAAAWTGAPTSGEAYLFYAFDNDVILYVRYENGDPVETDAFYSSKGDFYLNVTEYQYPYFYTSAVQEIELTKAGANQWTLGQTPDYDLELQVEYYEAHALKDIPAGWTVMVNDIDKTAAIVGDSLMITETDAVTLIPDGNPRRVKSVTLADDVPPTVTFTVKRVAGTQSSGYTDGTYTVAAGTTWQQFLESGNAPACLSIGAQKIVHDINNTLSECTGTFMVNTADNKYIKTGDAIIDGATYACDQYVGYQGHF